MTEISDIEKKPLFENLDRCLNELSHMAMGLFWEQEGHRGLVYLLFCHHYGLRYILPNGILQMMLEQEKKESLDLNEDMQDLADALFADLQGGDELFQDKNAEPYRRFLTNYIYLSDKYYCEVIDYIINYIQAVDRFGWYGTTPDITNLIATVAKSIQVKSVFDPCAGICNLACFPLMRDVQFYGQEVNYWTSNLARVRLLAHKLNSTCVTENSCSRWPDDLNQFDALVSELPLGSYVPSEEAMRELGRPGRRMIDDIFMHRFLMSPIRKCVMLVPLSFCYRRENFDIRKELVGKKNIQAIIALPAGAIRNIAIPTCLVVVDKLIKRGSVRFVDASDCLMKNAKGSSRLDVPTIIDRFLENDNVRTCNVQIEEIFRNDCVLTPALYTNLTEYPEGFKVVELGDLVEFVSGEKRFDDKKGHLAKISSLSTDSADCIRAVDYFEETDKLSNATKITEPVILLSSIRDLKPTYCEASIEHPLFVHPNVFVCRITKSWVSPTYLCLEISRRGSLFMGGVIPRIPRATLMKIKVAFPSIDQQRSLEEQNNLYKEASEGLKLAKVKEMGLQEIIDKMKAEYMLEVRNRKHDMKTPMVQLRSTLKLLSLFSEELPKEESAKLNVYIQRQKAALDALSEIVRHLADENKFAEPEILNVDEILSGLISNESYYSIKYWKDDISFEEAGITTPYVNMGHSDFLRLVNNIIGNAIDHGFTDKTGHYAINIYTYIEDGSLRISFQNDGEPLPQEIDKERYGMRLVKGKESKGQGTGGYVVKSIVEHYGGDYDVYVEKLDDGAELTFVDVKIPIYCEDE